MGLRLVSVNPNFPPDLYHVKLAKRVEPEGGAGHRRATLPLAAYEVFPASGFPADVLPIPQGILAEAT